MSTYAIGDTVQHHGGDVFAVRDVQPCMGDAEFHQYDTDTDPHAALLVHAMGGPAWVCERRVSRLAVQ